MFREETFLLPVGMASRERPASKISLIWPDVMAPRITDDLGSTSFLEERFGAKAQALYQKAERRRGLWSARAYDVLMLMEYGREGRSFDRVRALGLAAAREYTEAGLQRTGTWRYVALLRAARILRLVVPRGGVERREMMERMLPLVRDPSSAVAVDEVATILEDRLPCDLLEIILERSDPHDPFFPRLMEIHYRTGCARQWHTLVGAWVDAAEYALSRSRPALALAFSRRVERLFHERAVQKLRPLLERARKVADDAAVAVTSPKCPGTVRPMAPSQAIELHVDRAALSESALKDRLRHYRGEIMDRTWGVIPLLPHEGAFYGYGRTLQELSRWGRCAGSSVAAWVLHHPDGAEALESKIGGALEPSLVPQTSTALRIAWRGRITESLTLLVPVVEQHYRQRLWGEGRGTTVTDGCSGLPVQVGLAALLERSADLVPFEERMALSLLLTDLMGPNIRTGLAHGLIHGKDGWRSISRDDPLLWCAWAWCLEALGCL